MRNGLVAHVELEHEIVKWTSSITNSLALTCNTVLKRCSVALNGSGKRRVAQPTHKWCSVGMFLNYISKVTNRDLLKWRWLASGGYSPSLEAAR